jgi:hypothetical protein
MKQYDEERQKNIPALGSSKSKVNHVKVLWKLHQQSLCWAGPYGQVLKKTNFTVLLRWDTLCRISMTSLSGVFPRAVYEAFMDRVQGREHSKTKAGNDSVLSSTKILQQELGMMWSSMYFILSHISPSPTIPQPDHADTQLCDLIMAITSELL